MKFRSVTEQRPDRDQMIKRAHVRGATDECEDDQLVIMSQSAELKNTGCEQEEEQEEEGLKVSCWGEQGMEDLLPAELTDTILSYVGKVSWPCCQFVCRRWYQVLRRLCPRRGYSSSRKFMSQVAHRGWIGILKWAHAQGCPWDERTCEEAAGQGHLEILQWARAQGCPWNKWVCAIAAKGGHLEIVQWAKENGCPWDKDLVCCYARRPGRSYNKKLMEWLETQEGQMDPILI